MRETYLFIGDDAMDGHAEEEAGTGPQDQAGPLDPYAKALEEHLKKGRKEDTSGERLKVVRCLIIEISI